MAIFRLDLQYGPIDALLQLQHELEQALSNPFGLDLGLSGRGVFPLAMFLATGMGTSSVLKFQG